MEQIVKYWLPILAIILSIGSFIYTLIVYRSNRRLATAQRFNNAMEKYMMIKSKEIEVITVLEELKIKHGSNIIDETINKILDNILITSETIRKDLFEKVDKPENLDILFIENKVQQLNKNNILVQDVEKWLMLLKYKLKYLETEHYKNELLKGV